jgi:hypothetical protein
MPVPAILHPGAVKVKRIACAVGYRCEICQDECAVHLLEIHSSRAASRGPAAGRTRTAGSWCSAPDATGKCTTAPAQRKSRRTSSPCGIRVLRGRSAGSSAPGPAPIQPPIPSTRSGSSRTHRRYPGAGWSEGFLKRGCRDSGEHGGMNPHAAPSILILQERIPATRSRAGRECRSPYQPRNQHAQETPRSRPESLCGQF